jgi:DNA polymerase III delta prime subunit
MNDFKPNCLDDFLFSQEADRNMLELILSGKLPFPFQGKSGLIFHGTWGTGKSTLSQLMPELIEAAASVAYNLGTTAGQLAPISPSDVHVEVFRCGGGLSSTGLIQVINKFNARTSIFHHTRHDYFVFDEVDRLTVGAQQSLRSVMDLKRCMFFFSTNYLEKLDRGIINRCHLIEMNQVTDPTAYVPIGQKILKNMGIGHGVVPVSTISKFANEARGSLRDFSSSLALEGLKNDGTFPVLA